MHDVHVRVPTPLLDDARKAVAAPVGLAALIRLALAKLAGWPDAAASVAARAPELDSDGPPAGRQAGNGQGAGARTGAG